MKDHHHHDHGKDASVPAKGSKPAIPNKEWEKQYVLSPCGSDTPAGAFLPKRGRERPQPHEKVNECDH